MTKAAFKATYSDWKLIKTRSVVQVVLEIPLEQADAAYQVLGGMPTPGAERWCAVARLNGNEPVEAADPVPVSDKPDRPHRPRKPVAAEKRLAMEAGRMCADPIFRAFLRGHLSLEWPTPSREEDAAETVRIVCGVSSRAEILPGSKAAEQWINLRGQFEAWKLVDAA